MKEDERRKRMKKEERKIIRVEENMGWGARCAQWRNWGQLVPL